MFFSDNVTIPASALGGLLVRRECWTLSWRGKLLALLLSLVLAFVAVRSLYPFLAVNSPVPGEILVVEGWIRSDTLDEVAREYREGNYQTLVIVKDVRMSGDRWETGRYKADYLSTDLGKLGVPKDHMHLVFCDAVMKDRTYHAALAVKDWLRDRATPARAISVATQGAHARRSRLLYQKAFGPEVRVGVIALTDTAYDSRCWWRSSEGLREVLFEGAAYFYARLWFQP